MEVQSELTILTQDLDYSIDNQSVVLGWLESVVEKEKQVLGVLTYILSSDQFLLEMNRKYLNHDYYTDVITFDYSKDNQVSGDVFISIDRVEENARKYGVSPAVELNRVMVHGLLHLLGYDDKSPKTKQLMKERENFYLNLLTK